MPNLSQEQFTNSIQAVTDALITTCEGKQLSANDAAGIIGAALVQVLAHYIGPLRTVEHLRNLSDITERQCINDMSAP